VQELLKFKSSRCYMACPTSWSTGLAATPRVTRGSSSGWTTSPTAWRPSQPSSRQPAPPYPILRQHCQAWQLLLQPSPCWLALQSRQLLPGTWSLLVGRTILYWWLTDRWQRCIVARLCPCWAFSHVVAYSLQILVLCCTAESLLNSSSY
jgi:hypothetical protein